MNRVESDLEWVERCVGFALKLVREGKRKEAMSWLVNAGSSLVHAEAELVEELSD